MRELALEVRLQRDSPALHMPRPILELRPHQELDSALVSRTTHSQSAALSQRHERLAGRISIRAKRPKLGPATIRPLFAGELTRRLPDDCFVRPGPPQAQQLKRTVFCCPRPSLRQPACRELHSLLILGALRFWRINLNCPQRAGGHLKVARFQ